MIPLLVERGGPRRTTSLPGIGSEGLPEADLRIKGGHFVEMEGERLVWQLEAKTAQLFEKKNYVLLEQVNAHFYQEDGRKIQLEGQKGNLKLDTKELRINGKVKARSSDGVQLTTESLHWENNSKRLSSQDWVSIERDNFKIVGKGMEADTQLSKLIIKEQVTTYINQNAKIIK